MASFLNTKGTTFSSFSIGKGGPRIYQGSSDPGSANVGDFWLDTNGQLQTYQGSAWELIHFDNLTLSGNTISATNTNGNIILSANGSGIITTSSPTTFTSTVTISTVDINGGNIDGTTIGGTTPAGGYFTEVGIGVSPSYLLEAAGTGNEDLKVSSTGADSLVGVRMENDAREWRSYVAGTSSDAFVIRDITGAVNALTLAAGTGNAEFAGNVGIGTFPSYSLHIKYSGVDAAQFENDNAGANVEIRLTGTPTGGGSRTGWVGFDPDANTVFFKNGGVKVLEADSSGRVGIGGTPTTTFEVFGTARIGNGTHYINIDYNSPNDEIRFSRLGTGGHDIGIAANGDISLAPASGGNVGIGLTSPGSPLAVQGQITSHGDTNTSRLGLYNNNGGNNWILGSYDTGDLIFTSSGSGTIEGKIHSGGGFSFNNSNNNTAFNMDPDGNLEINDGSLELTHLGAGSASQLTRYTNVLQHYVRSNNVSGTIVISLPSLSNDVMLRVSIKGYEYNPDKGPWEFVVGGYARAVSTWINTGGVVYGDPPYIGLRVAYDSNTDSHYIMLGTTSSIWDHPQFTVDVEIAGFNANTGVKDGWSAEVTTSEPTVTQTVDVNPPQYGRGASINGKNLLALGNGMTISGSQPSGGQDGDVWYVV